MEDGVELISWVGYALILLVALGFSVGLRRLSELEERRRLQRWVPAAHVVVWGVAASMVILGVASYGFTSTLVLVVLVVAGVGVAAYGWFRNILAGLVLVSEADITSGDHLEVTGLRGEVESLGIRSLRLRDADGVVHDIPHSVLLETPVSKFPDIGELALNWTVFVAGKQSPEETLQRVKMLVGLAPLSSPRRQPQALLGAPPVTGQPLEVMIRAYPCSAEHTEALKSDILRRLAEAFDEVYG